jgi:hypothetical protein
MLALHFAHGAALNTMDASLEIALNNTPVYSIRLNELNVEDTWNSVPLPNNIFTAGRNTISFTLSGLFDRCIDEKFARGLWVTIFKDSFLHLPHLANVSGFDLTDFPVPFSEGYGLTDLTFLMPEESTASEIEGLLKLAYNLGGTSGSNSFVPRVKAGGTPAEQELSGAQLIAIGRPTANQHIAAANDLMPLPFVPGTDEIQQSMGNVIYRLPTGVSLGLVQLLSSPWDPKRALLAITGTTDEAVKWAVDALVNDNLDIDLSGNLVIGLRPDTFESFDTREPLPTPSQGDLLSQLTARMTPEATTAAPTPTTVPTLAPTPVAAMVTPAPALPAAMPSIGGSYVEVPGFGLQPIWLLIILGVSGLIVLIAIFLYIRQSKI